MAGWVHLWFLAGFFLYLGGAAVSALGAGWIWTRGDKDRSDHNTVVFALALTSAWCVIVAALGPKSISAGFVEVVRNIAWFLVIYRLFENDGRHESLRPIRSVVAVLGFVELLQIILLLIESGNGLTDKQSALVFQICALFRVMVAVGVLVLLHNLYVGAMQSVRGVLRWTAAALAAMWAFDLNFFTVAYLGGDLPIELAAIRGLVVAIMTIPLAIGSTRSAASIRLRPSRSVTFQTLSLLVIGTYLLLMVGIAQSLALLGGDAGRLTQVGFTFAATVVALLWLPSHRLRGWVRVTAIKHLFQHRYDYRAEWLRFTQTIGKGEASGKSLHERAVQAVADITDSPSGLLLVPGDSDRLELAARWAWRDITVPADPVPMELAVLFERKGFILDIDDVRGGKDQHGESYLVPEWLVADPHAWAMVPLLHFDKLVGVVVLARPIEARRLDWEDFDLLRVVGQQLASYLSEQSGQQSLMESARFDEFNRRIAFVMHDIKNLASQMSLLAYNAEKHAEKPAFRADMLVTLRKSADKLNGLLARLNRYGANGSEERGPVDLLAVTRKAHAQYAQTHNVVLSRADSCVISGNSELLAQALLHLIQNGIDATSDGSPICLAVFGDGGKGVIEVVDSGTGMTPEFIRDGLFKPFVSSKNAGFGIGAFEAREIVRSMGGQLEVESREGLGTRFILSFPLKDLVDQVADRASTIPSEAA